MSRLRHHREKHVVGRIRWLRAAVLGANDGLISTSSLILGVAAASASPADILLAGNCRVGCWGDVHGCRRICVSVCSQADAEQADLARERQELQDNIGLELDELTQIYVKRGVEPKLARQVAEQLMEKDALLAHAHDELGITEITNARPVQAAWTSAVSFSVGAALPLLVIVLSPARLLIPGIVVSSLFFMALFGLAGR